MYSDKQIVEVDVVKITAFGAFCKLDKGAVGLIHISEISDYFVKNIESFFKVGDKIKVQILEIKSNSQVCLSYKSIRPDLLRTSKKN